MSSSSLIQEMTTTLRTSKGQLDVVNQQLSHLERQEKIAQVTTKELDSYPNDDVWRSCGKAFVLQKKNEYIKDLNHDENLLKDQKKALEIKQNYLKTTVEKTVDGLKAVLNQQQQQQKK
ncbi:prefolding complex chaperone subunit NDAI_0B00340 [Naumovozyma dairenensis CBS 421]|uniref:Prefoldin subunit 1 n=1 Tax=Naumovozyma dairenensis (strain ATCC 10597 / BCRC 20456 / CBS 421 / NBRC 0211 / NRRL Y-12639) TaxID=1071378 RepID=G0W5K7_NAUDC|nr:hypothetical protein NDAI_0B00340 [Naumovozyma dairenensis CBS 421]CCD23068.1 hypothetical protein NDAI_0B00340 [Naumovozyma dairenensis CBS 421]